MLAGGLKLRFNGATVVAGLRDSRSRKDSGMLQFKFKPFSFLKQLEHMPIFEF